MCVCDFHFLKWLPKCEVLSKCKEAVLCLLEKIHVLDKLHSVISYSAVDHEFNVRINNIY